MDGCSVLTRSPGRGMQGPCIAQLMGAVLIGVSDTTADCGQTGDGDMG
jgi:hypothetical protein